MQDIDECVRRHAKLSTVQMQDELMERIVRGFNGDDAFLLKELSAVDKSGRGLLESPLFVEFFLRNSP